MAVQTFSKTGAKSASNATLPKGIFDLNVVSTELLKQAYSAYEANSRRRLAQTKTRADVRGGGRKPWRQKGTGRARVGTIRSPLWRTGGIIFGPTASRSFARKLNRKAATTALKQALSLAAQDGRIAVIEAFEISDGKTRTAAKIFKSIGLSRGLVLVTENPDEPTLRAVRNLESIVVATQPNLTAYDVLTAHHVVFTKPALAALETRLKETT